MFVYLQPQSLPLGLQKRAVGQQKSIRKRGRKTTSNESQGTVLISNFQIV